MLNASKGVLHPEDAALSLARVNSTDEQVVVADLTRLGLSPRESEVLLWVMRGKTNEEIAAELKISPRTVKKHLERIYRKLGVGNRVAAAFTAGQILKSINVA